MFGLSFNDFFQKKIHHQNHMRKLTSARSAIDISRPKSKLKCTKQPLSQFHRVYQMEVQNRHLYYKITKPQSSIQNRNQNRKLIKNNRKQYYQDYERNLENNGLVRRIKSAKTSYNSKKLMAERKQNEQYLEIISKFGYKRKKNTHFNFATNIFSENSQPLLETYRQAQANKTQSQGLKIKAMNFSERNSYNSPRDSPNKISRVNLRRSTSRK